MQNLIKWGKEYLYLWLLLLIQATYQGIDIHHINSSIPLLFFISDAIKRVIGGFNSEVIAWCFEFPLSMQGIFFLSILELIAAKITIYITLKVLQVKKMEYGIKMHYFTYSSGALGCMYHSTFNSIRDKAHDKVARILARDMLEFKSSFGFQHIKGYHNDAAESLSRDFHLSSPQITHILYKLIPTQTPKNLNILEKPI